MKLISENNRRLRERFPKSVNIFVVVACYAYSPEDSFFRVFADYATAKAYFSTLLPDPNSLQESEERRVIYQELEVGDPDYIHDIQYYLNNDYCSYWETTDYGDEIYQSSYYAIITLPIEGDFDV